MKHELPDNPKWTIVEGQIVYVCCPPCTEKIAAEPALFLKQVDELYLASLQANKRLVELLTETINFLTNRPRWIDFSFNSMQSE